MCGEDVRGGNAGLDGTASTWTKEADKLRRDTWNKGGAAKAARVCSQVDAANPPGLYRLKTEHGKKKNFSMSGPGGPGRRLRRSIKLIMEIVADARKIIKGPVPGCPRITLKASSTSAAKIVSYRPGKALPGRKRQSRTPAHIEISDHGSWGGPLAGLVVDGGVPTCMKNPTSRTLNPLGGKFRTAGLQECG